MVCLDTHAWSVWPVLTNEVRPFGLGGKTMKLSDQSAGAKLADEAYNTEVCTCTAKRSEHADRFPGTAIARGHGELARTDCVKFTWDGRSGPYAKMTDARRPN